MVYQYKYCITAKNVGLSCKILSIHRLVQNTFTKVLVYQGIRSLTKSFIKSGEEIRGSVCTVVGHKSRVLAEQRGGERDRAN